MARASSGACAWGGCDDTPRPGLKYCDVHTRQIQLREAALPVSAFGSAPGAATRSALPYEHAGPIAGKAPTSKAAALNVADTYVSKKGRILLHLVACGAHGATRPEIARALDLPINSVNSACNTLYRQGLVGSNPGDVRADPNTGNDCAVLVGEDYVDRWKGRPRRNRSVYVNGGECELVHPVTGDRMTETQRAVVVNERRLAEMDRDDERAGYGGGT